MTKKYSNAGSAEFLIDAKRIELCQGLLNHLLAQGEKAEIAGGAAGGFGAGFLSGVGWFAQELFTAMERDQLVPKHGTAIESFYLIEAALSVISSNRGPLESIMKGSIQ